jgi:SAM-dependent methyltransferase
VSLRAVLAARARSRVREAWYDYVSVLDRRHDLTVMNYGYLDGDPEPEMDRLQTRLGLYERLLLDTPLAGRDVLEVGCGRGGGAAYLVRARQPRRLVGLDLSRQAVAFCARQYADVPGLAFVRGDACRLATVLPPASFDVVLNVESSHSYPELGRFIREVERVLLPGGTFLFTDFRRDQPAGALAHAFETAGLAIVEREDITPGVLRALDADCAWKAALIERRVPRLVRPTFRSFAALPDTGIYREFRTGSAVYWRYVLRKPDV